MVSKVQYEKMCAEVKLLVELFLKTNKSDVELEKLTGISSSTVGRRLTNKELYDDVFGEKSDELFELVGSKRKQNLQNGKIIGGKNAQLNNIYLKNDLGYFMGSSKVRLDVFFKDPEKQLQLLKHIILTFRIKLPLLASLLGQDEDYLYQKLTASNQDYQYTALIYLFNGDYFDQEMAKANFLKWYRDYLQAFEAKDKLEKQRIVNIVTDSKISSVIKKHYDGIKLDDNDIFTMLNYQLKYSLTNGQTANLFEIHPRHYLRLVTNYIENNPLLQKRYDELAYYHRMKSIRGRHA